MRAFLTKVLVMDKVYTVMGQVWPGRLADETFEDIINSLYDDEN